MTKTDFRVLDDSDFATKIDSIYSYRRFLYDRHCTLNEIALTPIDTELGDHSLGECCFPSECREVVITPIQKLGSVKAVPTKFRQ